VLDAGEAAGPRRLLVGVRAVDDVAEQADTGPVQRLQGEQQRSEAALHVVDPAAPQGAAPFDDGERVALPVLARLRGDGVDVTVQQQRATPALAGQTRGELRAALEVEVVGHESIARAGRRRLPDVDLGADGAQAGGQGLLQARFLARRVADLAGGRVEGDELADQLDELVAPVAHQPDDPLLDCAQRLGHGRDLLCGLVGRGGLCERSSSHLSYTTWPNDTAHIRRI
jgi:hypothetical protein